MWYLTSDVDHRVLYVVPNKEITIGRSTDVQVCNFAIPEDASISRKHATLTISNDNLYLQDLGSRYGTFINNYSEKVNSNTQVKVNNKDTIRFGKLTSVWQVHSSPFVTCTSTLKGENLQNVKQWLNALGGVLKSDWSDSCVYLTMPAITLTIKVVLALSQGAYIVTTDFWSKCVDAVKAQTPLPDPKNFVPQVVESTLNKEHVSFLPNEKRKTLFAGKNIIFFSRRQLDMYKVALIKCSANPQLLSETKMSKSSLCEQDVIVIQYNLSSSSQETQAQKDQINDILNYLKSKGKRVIADAEIGLSILYCSIDKYCNPDFNFSSEVIKQAPTATKPSNVLAMESQEPTQKISNENVVISETLTPNAKRKLDEDDEEEIQANKKFATGRAGDAVTNNDGGKRKLEDDDNQNPNKKLAINNDDDMFNFLNNAPDSNNQNSDKTLNFTKPSDKKQNSGTNEDDLFNFVQDKIKENSNVSNKDSYAILIKKEVNVEGQQGQKRKLADDSVDLTALRGAKLKELMEYQTNWSANYNNIKIKKEEPDDDLDSKMNDLDLGTTILTVRKDLIVKREPIHGEEIENHGAHRNFKKFKKVWPMRKQVTFVPKATMSIVIPDSVAEEITSQSY